MTQDSDRISHERACEAVVLAANSDPHFPNYSQPMYFAVQACEEALGLRPTVASDLASLNEAP